MTTQLNLINLQHLPNAKTAKKINKAWKTWWLSTDSAIRSAVENSPAIIQTLLKLQGNCPTSAGLLRHMNTAKLLSTMYSTFCIPFCPYSLMSPKLSKGQWSISVIWNCVWILQRLPWKRYPIEIEEFKSTTEMLKADLLDFEVSDRVVEDTRRLSVPYTDTLVRNTDDQFKAPLPVMTALSIFDPLLVPSAGHVKSCGFLEIKLIEKWEFQNFQQPPFPLKSRQNQTKRESLSWRLWALQNSLLS